MGFLFFPVMPMGLRWAALRAAGAPLLIVVIILIVVTVQCFGNSFSNSIFLNGLKSGPGCSKAG